MKKVFMISILIILSICLYRQMKKAADYARECYALEHYVDYLEKRQEAYEFFFEEESAKEKEVAQ